MCVIIKYLFTNIGSSSSRVTVDATLNDHNGVLDGVAAQSNASLSPGGTRYWKPLCCINKRPFIGQLFDTIDEGRNFYKDYGRVSGFDTRSSSAKHDKNNILLIKYFVCNREGFCDVECSEKVDEGVQKFWNAPWWIHYCS